ncbi:MAG TPA: N-acetylmuramidase domain-containing protein [Candidatus Polarisedimenticolia bacterium]|nr:N-acetylmuramidase domain-containing protein [Candidatus Polarisedimenticolia bacterium]
MDFRGTALPLSSGGLTAALTVLTVPAPDIWTVIAVETGGCGFLPDRRPIILFERHIFHRRTNGAFDATHPAISNPISGGYLGGAREYDRLAEAVALDRVAALESASWGIAQIMGFNAAAAGFASAEAMVAAMMAGEDAQVAGMATFLRTENLHVPLAAHDFVAFARGYNGPNFAQNQYDQRLAAAFRQLTRGPLPDLQIRQAQVLLMFLGISPGRIDGITGPRTKGAVVQFRQQQGLPASDQIDTALIAALTAAVGSLA